jgi:F0F1-type ATP synthase membrane subunit a
MCSGVCKNPGYFVYSNVNNGKPTTSCFSALQSYRLNKDLTMLALSTTITVAIAVVIGLIFVGIAIQIYRGYLAKKKLPLKKAPSIERESDLSEKE